MKIILQRVAWAQVEVANIIVGKIEQGLLVFVGIAPNDTPQTVLDMSQKIANLRIFSDTQGKMNQSLMDIQGHILLVSQFTLFADCSQGRRPYFGNAAKPEHAKRLFDYFTPCITQQGVQNVQTGIFGADMQVKLCNDGPVTIMLES